MVDADQMDAHSRECRLDVVVFNAEQRLAKLQRAIEREISSRRSPPLRSGRPAAAAAAAPATAAPFSEERRLPPKSPIASMLGKFGTITGLNKGKFPRTYKG